MNEKSENEKIEPMRVEIGWKDGRVIFNAFGTSTVAPSHIIWTPAEAREAARLLLVSADAVDGTTGIEGAAK